MAIKRMQQIEKAHGALEEIIPRLVNQGGQKMAAEILNVSQSTISVWLKDNGYKAFIVYRKSEGKEKTA